MFPNGRAGIAGSSETLLEDTVKRLILCALAVAGLCIPALATDPTPEQKAQIEKPMTMNITGNEKKQVIITHSAHAKTDCAFCHHKAVEGNIYVGILAYTIGMVLFTIIMGNAFAAITVMTVGVGVPFVMNLGADPLYMITLALTTGYCGTLLTPMAANFNIVPGIYLETENKYSIIKMQVVPAILMFIFQVSYMCIVAK